MSKKRSTLLGVGKSSVIGARAAWPLLLAAVVAGSGLLLLSWWNQERIEDQMRTDTGNALTTVRDATTGSVQQWFLEREEEAKVWAGHADIREDVRVLVETESGAGTRASAAASTDLHLQLDEFALGMGYQGYLVLSPEGTVLATHDPAQALPGARNVVGQEFLSDVLSAPRFGAIELPHILSLEDGTQSEPTILVGAAIRETDGQVLAALVLLVDPQQTFTQILQRGRIGESGESYAFDRRGQLISESRFDDQLRDLGLISGTERGILNIDIRDPGGNLTEGFQPTLPRADQALTLMAESAISAGPGTNLDGYNDYRGVPVVGAWTWDETNGIGIATEMDVAEAYRSALQLRRSAFLSALVSVVLVLALTGLFLRNRVRMAEAHSELEKVVGNLQNANDELENVNSVILRWDPKGTVTFLNDFGLQLFGFSRDEIIGKPVLGTIVPEDESTGRSLVAMIGEIQESPGKFESNENEVITKSGELLWMAWRNKPISNEDGTLKEILTVGIDITARKRAEVVLNMQSTALDAAADGIGITDTKGTLVWVNPAFCELTGYSRAESVGQNPRVLKSGAHDAAFYQRMWETISSGHVWSGEVVNKRKDGSFYTEEMTITPVCDTDLEITNYVAIKRDITERKAMEAELQKARLRMEDELNVGREIQMSMLPLIFPAFPRRGEFDVFALLEPAREVGGDFYDFFLLDDDHYCVCVGDVSGKGVPAALFMAVTKTLIKSRASNDYSPASILTHVNDEISRNNDASMFVTIFLAILDLNSGELRYTNAGHNPPYLRRGDGELVRIDQRHGPVIGALEGMVYGEDVLRLGKGDQLFAYTDGITEAMNEDQALYEEPRLVDVLSSLDSDSPKASVHATMADVRDYQGDAEQADDITIIATTFYGKPEGTEMRVLDLVLSNQLKEISRANDAFDEFAEAEGLDVKVRRSTNLVIDELLNNIISYAFKDDEEHRIDVRFELASDRLSLTISDGGVPFNPFAGSPPNTGLTIDEREVGGLGIHLVRNMMDEVSYNRRTDKNVVILVKYLESESAN